MQLFARMTKAIRKTLSSVSYTCDGCGKELFDYPTRRLCDDCEEKLHKNDGNTCKKCGRKTFTDGVCLDCKRHLPAFTQGVSPFVYSGLSAGLVNRLKNGDRHLCFFFGERMAEKLLQAAERQPLFRESLENPLIVPVPLTEQKRRSRGYNQALALAEGLMVALERAGIKAELCDTALVKVRESRQQKHLSVTEREKNAQGAYHLHIRKIFRDRHVILIDDIMTTGATGSVCGRLLLNAKAKSVTFLTAVAAPEQQGGADRENA